MAAATSLTPVKWIPQSTDIDVQITGTTDLTEIRKGREGDLAWRLGGKWELDARNQVKVRLEDGVIDVSTVRTQPNRGAYDVEIDGRRQTVLSTTQILRGKLERAEDPGPVRDAYDLATAAKRDPEALTAAVGMLPDERAKRIATDLRKRRKAIGEAAQRRITAHGPDRIAPDELGKRASGAIDDHRTVYVRVELRKGRVRATRYTRNGRPHSHEWSPARAKFGLVVTGLADYIHENTNGSMRRIGMNIDRAVADGRDQTVYEAGSLTQAETLQATAKTQSEPLGRRDDSKNTRARKAAATETASRTRAGKEQASPPRAPRRRRRGRVYGRRAIQGPGVDAGRWPPADYPEAGAARGRPRGKRAGSTKRQQSGKGRLKGTETGPIGSTTPLPRARREETRPRTHRPMCAMQESPRARRDEPKRAASTRAVPHRRHRGARSQRAKIDPVCATASPGVFHPTRTRGNEPAPVGQHLDALGTAARAGINLTQVYQPQN